MKDILKNNSGSALVTLLIFVAAGITVTTAATAVTLINTQGSSELGVGERAMEIAEAGAEEAVIRLIRNYDYSGETIDIEGGQANITVSGTTTKTINSVGVLGDYTRKIQVTAEIVDDTITLIDWGEIN